MPNGAMDQMEGMPRACVFRQDTVLCCQSSAVCLTGGLETQKK